MNKKLAIVNHNLGSGGAEKLIYDMALELKERKYKFSVILLTSVNDIYGKKLQEVGIDVIYLSDKWDIYSPKNIFRLKKILKNYDVIHTHTYASQLWVAFVSLFLDKSKKYITTEHSTNNRRREKKYFKCLDRWMYNRYNIIVNITENVEKSLKKWLESGIKSKYTIISNGINLNKYLKAIKKDRIKEGFSKEDKLIIMIGRFTQAKNHETLLKALKELPINFKVLLAGEGELKEEVKNKIKELEIENRVNFLGYRNDIAEIIKMSDIGVLSSNWEGLPLSAIEIMASEIPFLGSNVMGIKDLCKNDLLLFENKNFKQLKKKILDIQKNKNLREEMILEGKRISQKYEISKVTDDYIRIYEEEKK